MSVPALIWLAALNGRAAKIYFLDDNSALSARDSVALEVVSSVLGQAHQLCGAEGAKFLFLFIPTKFRVYGKVTTFDADAPPSHLVLNELPSVLEAMVRTQLPEARFLDLTPALTEDARRGSLTYLSGYDSHWSPEGNRVAAAPIAQVLRQWNGL
jgi:acetyltransferase AlgX (SGNH hydrolase-like protein)